LFFGAPFFRLDGDFAIGVPRLAACAYNAAMSTTVRLTPHGEALLQKQLANGSYRSPEEVVERALETLAKDGEQSRLEPPTKTPAGAVADIREIRKGLTLGGLRIRDLIHEGHKF
jgi:Arc/MetJ-type ribon-helix-helix transcriptional regulator